MYKLQKPDFDGKLYGIQRFDDGACIPIDPANTDYALFKEQINDNKAELQDADGNVMSPEAAKAFVATLP